MGFKLRFGRGYRYRGSSSESFLFAVEIKSCVMRVRIITTQLTTAINLEPIYYKSPINGKEKRKGYEFLLHTYDLQSCERVTIIR